jgi:F0F1-type ATP synthase epsilon subunit
MPIAYCLLPKMEDQNKLKIRIASPEKVIWEGSAFAVSSTNSQGNFDILPQHASFLTIVENQPIKISSREKKVLQEFRPLQAVIYNRDNRVSIYTLGTSE